MTPPEQFLLFGDSLTICFTSASALQSSASLPDPPTSTPSNSIYDTPQLTQVTITAFSEPLQVIRQGFGGYNTSNALSILPSVIPTPEQANIKFLTIWFGANDCNLNPSTSQFVPIPKFRDNLKSIITHPQIIVHNPKIILLTPPAFSEPMLHELNRSMGRSGVTRKARDGKSYAEAVREVAREMGVEVMDVWSLFMERVGWDGYGVMPGEMVDGEGGRNEGLEGLLLDGVHLKPAGYEIVLEGLVKLIEEKWPDYALKK